MVVIATNGWEPFLFRGWGIRMHRQSSSGKHRDVKEELQGMPFVGAAGGNLNALLDHICWARERLFITNLIKYRPFSETGANRKPSLKESRYALSYLLRELAIVNPPWVVCLGSSAASVLLGQAGLKMSDINGRILTWDIESCL